jgi:hypothetical protein
VALFEGTLVDEWLMLRRQNIFCIDVMTQPYTPYTFRKPEMFFVIPETSLF